MLRSIASLLCSSLAEHLLLVDFLLLLRLFVFHRVHSVLLVSGRGKFSVPPNPCWILIHRHMGLSTSRSSFRPEEIVCRDSRLLTVHYKVRLTKNDW